MNDLTTDDPITSRKRELNFSQNSEFIWNFHTFLVILCLGRHSDASLTREARIAWKCKGKETAFDVSLKRHLNTFLFLEFVCGRLGTAYENKITFFVPKIISMNRQMPPRQSTVITMCQSASISHVASLLQPYRIVFVRFCIVPPL